MTGSPVRVEGWDLAVQPDRQVVCINCTLIVSSCKVFAKQKPVYNIN